MSDTKQCGFCGAFSDETGCYEHMVTCPMYPGQLIDTRDQRISSLEQKLAELERYRLHMETACKVGTATELQCATHDNEMLRQRLKEVEKQRDSWHRSCIKADALNDQLKQSHEAMVEDARVMVEAINGRVHSAGCNLQKHWFSESKRAEQQQIGCTCWKSKPLSTPLATRILDEQKKGGE